MFELVDSIPKNAEIKVVGVGGGGGNAVRHMIASSIDGVHFICANTDAQSLNDLENSHRILQLGGTLTKGLGAGANPEVGRQAALEDKERIAQAILKAQIWSLSPQVWVVAPELVRTCYRRSGQADGYSHSRCGHPSICL